MSAIELAPRRERPDQEAEETKKKRKKTIPPFPTALEFLVSVGTLGVGVWYLGWVAPGQVPVPPGTKVPFPQATAFLEGLCGWCGDNQSLVVAAAVCLFVTGLFLRFLIPKYFYAMAIVLGLFTGFTWYSISAPVDRLIKDVEDNIPQRKL